MSILHDCFGGQVWYIGGVSKLQKYQQVWKKWILKYEIMASTFKATKQNKTKQNKKSLTGRTDPDFHFVTYF